MTQLLALLATILLSALITIDGRPMLKGAFEGRQLDLPVQGREGRHRGTRFGN